MDEAPIAAIQKLRFEAPIKTRAFRIERALEGDDRLVEQRFIGAICEEMAEVLIVRRTRPVEGDAAFHPAVDFESRFRRLGFLHFLAGLAVRTRHVAHVRSGEGREGRREKERREAPDDSMCLFHWCLFGWFSRND